MNGPFFPRTKWEEKMLLWPEATLKVKIEICDPSEARCHKLDNAQKYLKCRGSGQGPAQQRGVKGGSAPLENTLQLENTSKNQFLQFNSIFLESMIYRKYSKKWIWWRSKLLAQYLRIIQKIQFLQIKSNVNEKKCRISFRKFA